ncbi:MAG: hypothetical protein K5886_04505, partial [Lachnospiraceae bacterium]|nr:hypothetical protein [Lachnospiraceae bacterium]
MRLSEQLNDIIHDSVDYSIQNDYELVTPETFLLEACKDPVFADAFALCGGNLWILENDLTEYLSDNLDT